MYRLKTELNENGKKTFVKKKQGGTYLYLVVLGNDKDDFVTRDWVISHLNEIANVEFKGNRLMPLVTSSTSLSPEQLKFFKDSLIRNSSGMLLPCYHGSNAKFDTFRQISIYPGYWFTEDYEYARTHGSLIYTVYLNIKRVLNLEELSNENYLIDFMKKYHNTSIISDRAICSKEFREYLIKQGFDGMAWKHDGFYTVVALYPNQIKATSNRCPTESNNINR